MDKDEIVIFADDGENIVDYVENLLNRTTKRTIANYIAWRFIEQGSRYLNDRLRASHATDPLSTECRKQTMKLYVATFDEIKDLPKCIFICMH